MPLWIGAQQYLDTCAARKLGRACDLEVGLRAVAVAAASISAVTVGSSRQMAGSASSRAGFAALAGSEELRRQAVNDNTGGRPQVLDALKTRAEQSSA
jgi:hypothetical protein